MCVSLCLRKRGFALSCVYTVCGKMPNENTHLWENEKSKQCGKAFDCSTSPAFTWLQPRWPAVFTRVQFTSAGILGTFYPRFLWFAFHMASERIWKIGVFCKADLNMFPKHLKWPFDCFSFLTVFFSFFSFSTTRYLGQFINIFTQICATVTVFCSAQSLAEKDIW